VEQLLARDSPRQTAAPENGSATVRDLQRLRTVSLLRRYEVKRLELCFQILGPMGSGSIRENISTW